VRRTAQCPCLRPRRSFAHGDLGGALGSNAAATVGYGVFVVVWTLWLARAARGRPLRIGLTPAWSWAVGGLLVAFTVVRNLPFGAVLAP
jgi:hypothetical protein